MSTRLERLLLVKRGQIPYLLILGDDTLCLSYSTRAHLQESIVRLVLYLLRSDTCLNQYSLFVFYQRLDARQLGGGGIQRLTVFTMDEATKIMAEPTAAQNFSVAAVSCFA